MKIHGCPMHIWKLWQFGNVAKQSTFGSCANYQISDVLNRRRVVFTLKTLKMTEFKSMKNCWYRLTIVSLDLRSDNDEPIFAKMQHSSCCWSAYQGCKESAKF